MAKGNKEALRKIATILGLGGTADKMIERDKKNTKSGKAAKKAVTTISKNSY